MKPHRSLIALVIAIVVHTVILFAMFVYEEKKEDSPTTIKRFGLHLSETTAVEETTPSEPPLNRSTDVKKHLRPIKAEKNPEQNKIADMATVSPQETAEPEAKALTRADADLLPPSVIHHYGEAFFDLSAGEQHYIIDNLQRIRKINEIVGTRLLRERPEDEIDPDDSNIVEFHLHPDGSISNLHLQKNRIGNPLDVLTAQTIRLAHPRYPKPEQTTLIRIRVYIVVK